MPRDYDDDYEDDEEEEEEEIEYVLFQGALDGTEADLRKNAKLVDRGLMEAKEMVTDAVSRRAQRCVLEPKGKVAVGKVVIDTIPHPAGKMPAKQALAVTQMIKLLSGMDIENRSTPQSGGMKAEYEEAKYTLYVKTNPVGGGLEKLDIQIVNDKEVITTPSEAGFSDEMKRRIRELTSDKGGIVIACGPPGSGVTTSMQMAVMSVDLYCFTVYSLADHGHADLHNVNQFVEKEGHDLETTFERMLRMDADWIYLDPVTDPAVFKAVMGFQDKAGFFFEVNTPDPGTAIARLIELAGGDAATIANSLRLIVTQKPIRLLCEQCREAYRPNPKIKKQLGLGKDVKALYRKFEPPPPPEDDEEEEEEEYEPCEHCDEVGYRGRTNMFEMVEINDALKEHIASGFDPAEFRKLCREKEGAQTMQSDGMRLVAAGKTSLEELQRVFKPAGGGKKKRPPRRR